MKQTSVINYCTYEVYWPYLSATTAPSMSKGPDCLIRDILLRPIPNRRLMTTRTDHIFDRSPIGMRHRNVLV